MASAADNGALPFAVIGSVAFGVSGLTRRSGRVWAICGLIISGLAVAAFVVMLNVAG